MRHARLPALNKPTTVSNTIQTHSPPQMTGGTQFRGKCVCARTCVRACVCVCAYVCVCVCIHTLIVISEVTCKSLSCTHATFVIPTAVSYSPHSLHTRSTHTCIYMTRNTPHRLCHMPTCLLHYSQQPSVDSSPPYSFSPCITMQSEHII